MVRSNGFYNTFNHPYTLNEASRLVENATLSRTAIADKLLDPRRSINDDCGYKDTDSITSLDYRELYDRESTATRVVQVLPMESWKMQPEIFETEDIENETAFEKEIKELSTHMMGGTKFIGDEGSPIWEHLFRADMLCGIGTYGVILLGLDDGLDLAQPAQNRKGTKLLFVRSFDESLASISQYEGDITNPRFGSPTMYKLTFNAPDNQGLGAHGIPVIDQDVHWTRVIHLADNLGSSEIFGVPRMQPVYNRLQDLRKLYGGSAEMYWRGAFPGISFETHPQLGGEVTIDSAAIKRQIEDYQNTLQRYISSTGMHANSLAPQVVDPTPQINTQLEAICILLGIPKRIFMGSERGELSSGQDNSTWNDRIRYRQNRYLTPRVIVPFFDRLIELGVLTEPQEYNVKWPDLDALSDHEQAIIAVAKTEAMAKYVGGNVEAIMVPVDFYTEVLGMDDDKAIAVVDEASAVLEQAEEEAAQVMLDEGFKMAPKDGFRDEPTEPPKGSFPFVKNEDFDTHPGS